jgi:hypothetical protein
MDAHQKLVGGTGDRRKASTHAESDAEEAMTCTMLKVVRGIDDLCPLEVNATVKLAAKESTVSSMKGDGGKDDRRPVKVIGDDAHEEEPAAREGEGKEDHCFVKVVTANTRAESAHKEGVTSAMVSSML